VKDGEHIDYYTSGEILCKYWYLDGKLNGVYIEYYLSGEVEFNCNFKDGKYHGESIFYYESGEINYKSYHIDHRSSTELEWFVYNRNSKFELLGL